MLRNFLENLKDVSPACKDHFLNSDSLLSAIIIGVSASVIPPMMILDYLYYGLTEKFFTTIFFEGIFVLLSLTVILGIRRAKTIKQYEWAVFIWTFISAIGFSLVGVAQPERIIENTIVVIIFTMALYTLITNRILFRVIPTLVMTFFYFYIFSSNLAQDIVPQQEIFLSAALFVINIGGLVVVARTNQHKQDDFSARQSEKEARLQFETLASIDPLTGIYNRRHFMYIFNLEMDRHKRYGSRLALVMMDLDHFKQINDKHGHLAGDEALKIFTRIIRENKRKTDTFGRLGGEEFGLLMMETEGEDALTTLQRFLTKVQNEKIVAANKIFNFTFSAGITEIRSRDQSIDDVIHRADNALYKAKENGRNRCVLN